jgi:hypothetical protein
MSHLPGRSILVVSAFLLAVAMAAPSGAAAQQQAGDNSRPVTLDTVAPRAITLDEALELAKQNAPRASAGEPAPPLRGKKHCPRFGRL